MTARETYARQLVRLADLERPLCFLDLESTGLDTSQARVIEVGMMRVEPCGATQTFSSLVQPGDLLAHDVTALTGITDEDLAGAPTFPEITPEVVELLSGADVAGYNVRRFDWPLLASELRRARCAIPPPEGRVILDAYLLYRNKERHTLEQAARYYLGRTRPQSHRALDDVEVTVGVLVQQLARYGYQGNVESIEQAIRYPYLDAEGRFKEDDEEIILCFGKHQGKSLTEVEASWPSYLNWIEREIGDEAGSIVKQWRRQRLRQRTPLKRLSK